MAVILERGVPTTIYVDGTMTHYLSDSADKQPKDPTLTALAALNATPGLVEQTGADAFTKRPMGVASATDVLTRADGDGRYLSAGTGYQPIDADLTAIAALDSSTSGAIASDGAGWIKKTYAQFKTALGLVKGDVGLGNVDNTGDVNKPVSTAQQTAIDAKTITLTGDVAGSGASSFAATIANDAVTNAKLANMATQTFKARNTAGTGDPEDLSVATVIAMLGLSSFDPNTILTDSGEVLVDDLTGNVLIDG